MTKLDAIRAYQLSEFIWNREKNYYTYPNGKRVPERALFGAIRRYQDRLNQSLQSATTAMIKGDITLAEWQSRVSLRIKQGHLELMRFGVGGAANAKVWHENDVNKRLQTVDFPALERFGRDLQDGKLSEKQIRARLELYARGTKASYEKARLDNKRLNGQQYGRRLLGKTDLHCEDCLRYAGLGWQRLEDIILPGTNCQCGANCLCSIEVVSKLPKN